VAARASQLGLSRNPQHVACMRVSFPSQTFTECGATRGAAQPVPIRFDPAAGQTHHGRQSFRSGARRQRRGSLMEGSASKSSVRWRMGRAEIAKIAAPFNDWHPLDDGPAPEYVPPSEWNGPHVGVRLCDAFKTLAMMPNRGASTKLAPGFWPEYHYEWKICWRRRRPTWPHKRMTLDRATGPGAAERTRDQSDGNGDLLARPLYHRTRYGSHRAARRPRPFTRSRYKLCGSEDASWRRACARWQWARTGGHCLRPPP